MARTINTTNTELNNEYESKLAAKRAKADAKKAVNTWHQLGTVDIYDVLSRMGYSGSRCGYRFTKRYWPGMQAFTLCLDTYGLIIGNTGKIDVEVR